MQLASCQLVWRIDILQNPGIVEFDKLYLIRVIFNDVAPAGITSTLCQFNEKITAKAYRVSALMPKGGDDNAVLAGLGAYFLQG